MAQEGNHSMEGSHPPSNSGQQSNVVDDFLAALFASNPPAHASKQQNQQQKEKQEPPQQQQQQQQQQHKPAQTQQVFHQPQQPAQGSLPGTSFKAVTTKRNASPRPKETRFQNKKRDRDIDEFEEYEMLSKRKQKPAPKKKGNGSGSDYSRMGAGRAQVVSPSSFNSNTTATASMAATSTASTIATTNGHAPAVNPNHPRNRHGGSFGRTPIPNSRLYINGLPYAVKKPAIIEHFSQFGPVNDVYLKNTYGFVQFQRPESCSAALHGGKHFEGTVLDLSTAQLPRNNDAGHPTRRDEQGFSQGASGHYHQDTGRTNRGGHRGRPYDRAGGDRGGYRKVPDNDSRPIWSSEPQSKYQANRGRGISYPGSAARGTGRGGAFSHQIPYNGYQKHHPQDPRLEHGSPAPRPQHQEFRPHPTENHPKNEPLPPMSKGYYGSSDVSTSYDHRGIRGRASGRGGRGGASRGSANGYHSPRMTSQEASPQSHSVPSAPLYPSHFQSHSSPHARAESGEKEKVSSPPSLVPLPRRHGQAVPVVQIVAWDDAEPTFVDYIEDAFRSLSVRVHALNLKHGQVSQDEIVKHLVKEGVMALVTVLPGMEIEQHVTLQVFQPDEQAGPGSFHFDEYEKIQVEDCTAVVEQLCETQKVLQDKMNVDQPPSTASNPDQPAYRSSPASLASSLRDLTTGDQPTPTISPHTAPLSAPMLASAFQAPVFSPVTAAQAPTAPSVSLPVNPPTSTTPAAPQPAISSALPAVLSAVQGLDLYSLDQNTLSSLIAAAQGLVNSQSQAAATPPVTNTQSLPAAAGPLPTSVIAQQPTLEAQPYVQQVSQVPLEQRQPFIQPAEQQQPQQLQQQQQHQQLPPQISPDPTALLSNPMIQQLLASMNRSSVSANGAPAAHETPAVHSGQAAVPQYNPQAPGLFPTATQTAISTNSAPTFDGAQTQVDDLLAQLKSTLTAQASVPQSR